VLASPALPRRCCDWLFSVGHLTEAGFVGGPSPCPHTHQPAHDARHAHPRSAPHPHGTPRAQVDAIQEKFVEAREEIEFAREEAETVSVGWLCACVRERVCMCGCVWVCGCVGVWVCGCVDLALSVGCVRAECACISHRQQPVR
jgi:hypothetical protein